MRDGGASYDYGRKLLEKMGKSIAGSVVQEMKKALE
jgi:hypothetical protein